jgi:hypothetical protein
MDLPKFMLVDHSDHMEDVFVLHTEYPRFIINLASEDMEWFEDVSKENEDELATELEKLVVEADKYYEQEMAKFENMD